MKFYQNYQSTLSLWATLIRIRFNFFSNLLDSFLSYAIFYNIIFLSVHILLLIKNLKGSWYKYPVDGTAEIFSNCWLFETRKLKTFLRRPGRVYFPSGSYPIHLGVIPILTVIRSTTFLNIYWDAWRFLKIVLLNLKNQNKMFNCWIGKH